MAVCLVPGARAEADVAQLPLEQLMQMEVRTASRYLQSALEAPAAVSVVTAEDIRTFGYRNLAEILASMRGLYVSYDRSYHYLGMRGFSTPGDYNTRVLLLVDGVRFNDNLYDQAPVGTDFPIDIDLIERVEFVPGPSAAVYGANAFFGVVNIITREGRQMKGAQLGTELGSHGHARLRFSLGTVDGYGGDWLVSATRSTQRGEDLYFPAYDTPGQNWTMTAAPVSLPSSGAGASRCPCRTASARRACPRRRFRRCSTTRARA
jgi:outer membrane cobalamin receptor